MTELARLPALFAAAGLLIAGAFDAETNERLSAALFAAGFIVLGAWLAMEIRAHRRKENDDGTS